MTYGNFGEAFEKKAPISAGDDPNIKDGEYPSVGAVSNEPPKPLLQGNDG